MASSFRHALLGAVLATLAPSGASAQADDVGRFRLAAYFALGLAGDADWNVDTDFLDASGSSSLEPTVGFGLRGELLIHQYVAIGGLFELLTFEADENEVSNAEREAVFNIDLWAKVRYVLELNPNLDMEVYGGIPFGLSLGVLNQSDGDGDDVWPGFNTGVLAGAMMILDSQFGFFLELGWRHHQIFHDESAPIIGDVASKIVTNQFALHAGAAFQF